MKLLTVLFVPIFCLELGTLASGQSMLDAFTALIQINTIEMTNSSYSINAQYNNMLAEINDELYNNILPTLNQTNYDIQDYIAKLYSELTSSGYNLVDCINQFENALRNVSSIASITNVTAKAIEENERVYKNILHNVFMIGISSIGTLNMKVNSIYDELMSCYNSNYVQYCNTTVYDKLVAQQEETPKLYKKVTEITRMNLIQQGVVYKNRVEDYVNEVIKTMKPYLALLEICAQMTLSFGQ